MKNCLITLLFCIASASHANFVLSDYFHPVGPSESLVAKFDHSVEATTLIGYKGLIGVSISNFGWDNPYQAYDAFYYFINASQNNWVPQKSGKGLNIAFDGDTSLSGTAYYIGNGGQSPNSLYQIAFNETVGPWDGINFYGIPDYNPDHIYNFVLDINSQTERILNFGFGDAGTSDDTGQWDITVTPVAIGGVPEPTSSVLVLIGMVYLGGLTRRRI